MNNFVVYNIFRRIQPHPDPALATTEGLLFAVRGSPDPALATTEGLQGDPLLFYCCFTNRTSSQVRAPAINPPLGQEDDEPRQDAPMPQFPVELEGALGGGNLGSA